MTTIPITELGPLLADTEKKEIKAVVTLLWPYSSSTRKVALLLADPDFRLRNRKGQVRVQLAGSAAQAVARSKIAIGDEVTLSLNGARWVDPTPSLFTPGKSVDVELLFKERLTMLIRREGSEIASLNVDEHDGSASSTSSPTTANGFANLRMASFHKPFDTSMSAYSPAFHKRARISEGSFVDSPIDPFAEDSTHPEERSWKRQRLSLGPGIRWKLVDRGASPPKQHEYEYWLEQEENTIRKESEAVEIFQSREPIPEEIVRIPDTLIDSTLLSTRAPTRYEASHDELSWHDDESENFASRFSQQLAQELGGDTEDEEEYTEKFPQLESPSRLSQVTGSQVQVTQELPEKQLEQCSEMPPPALPTLQTSQAALQQRSQPIAPHLFSLRSPQTPELHPLQSAALPVPSPFPGDQLETSSFFPPQPRDFTTPSSQSHTGMVPDYMFQFGFSLGGSDLTTARLGEAVDSSVDFQDLDHAITDQEGEDHPQSSPSTALVEPGEGPDGLDDDAQAPGPDLTITHVHEKIEETEEENGEMVSEKPHGVRIQLSPQQPETVRSSPKAGPIIIELLSDSESEVSSEEDEVGDEENADAEEARSTSVEESEAESSEPVGLYQDYGEEKDSEDDSESEGEYEASRMDENDDGSDLPSQRIWSGILLRQESASTHPIHEASASIRASDRDIPPDSSHQETVIIDLSGDSSMVERDVEDASIAIHSSPQQEIQNVQLPRRRLHSSQGQAIYPHSAPSASSQSSIGPRRSKLVIADTFEGDMDEDGSVSAQPPPDQIGQQSEVSEPEDHDMAAMVLKPYSPGDVVYPELPLDSSPYARAEQRSSPWDKGESQEDQEDAPVDLSIWNKQASSPLPTQIEIQESPPEILHRQLEEIPDNQPAFEDEAWPRFPSSPPISPAPAQSKSALFFGVDLSPETSQEVLPTSPPTQQPAQQQNFSTATTSVVSDSLLPSRQDDGLEEDGLEKRSSPSPEMQQAAQHDAIPPILSQIFASQINPSRESSPTLGKYATAKEGQESFTLLPETQIQAQESFTLKPESFDPQPSVSNDVPTETQRNSAVSSPKSQAKQSETNETPVSIAVEAPEPPASQFNRGLRTPLSYFTPLSSLRPYMNSPSQFDAELDVLAVVSHKSSDPKRAEKSPRDWYTQFNIVDASLPPLDDNTRGVRVQCFRRNKKALPKAAIGDVVLLRAFEVISAKGGLGMGLRSDESSAWCVWRFGQSEEASEGRHSPIWAQKAAGSKRVVDCEEVNGPPVEIGPEEREEVWRLKAWWESVDLDNENRIEVHEKEKETAKL